MGPTKGASSVNTQPHTGSTSYNEQAQLVRQLKSMVLDGGKATTSDREANARPSSDPTCRLPLFNMSLGPGVEVITGRIVDGSAAVNAYIVQPEREKNAIIATALLQTSQSVLGATAVHNYTAGTNVIVLRHPGLSQSFIIGAMPYPASTGSEAIHDCISQTSRARVDESVMRYLKMVGGSGMKNFSSWQPLDSTMASEWGAIATTGLNVSLDDFMVKMSVNEFTGVFGFYHDSLLRVAGYNMQTWTAGHERDAYMDQAEYNDTQGYTPYPWEHLGALKPGQDVVKEYTAADITQPSGFPYYGNWENKYENQQPFHRTQKFYGYYGQGSRTVVCAPPANAGWYTYEFTSKGKPAAPYESSVQNKMGAEPQPITGSDKETYSEGPQPPIGLSEDNTGMDGRRFIASAKGITLVKRLLLPVPTRLRRPEDAQGDDATKNYKAAGLYGSGAAHTITGDIQATDKHPHLQRAAGVLDLHSYLFNYAGLHPFFWHEKDYKTWEQSELEHASHNHVIPTYDSLKGSMYLTEPGHLPIRVDHRYGQQNFYASESFISMLEDGSIVIGDGYGAEIKMCAGSITISAPGDVWFKPGKSAQIWAGRDIIARANGNVDISTTEKNIRLKSEQNVMILAGNDSSERSGGVLIESRATAPTYNFEKPGDDVVFGGVVLRAKDSEVISLGKNIYMRTTGGYKGTGTQAGVITLDASRGTGTIMTKSRDFINYVRSGGQIMQAFGLGPEEGLTAANIFKKDMTMVKGPIYTDGPVVADGSAQGYSFIGRGAIVTNQGHIATGEGGPAGQCSGLCTETVNKGVNDIKYFINAYVPIELDKLETTAWQPLWYDENRPGNADTIRTLEFSFRTDDQYRVDGFELFEDRWQQLARLSEQELDTWEEKPVTTGKGIDTWPFPGRLKLSEEDVFVMQDFSIIENDGGALRDKDRRKGPRELADEYKTPSFGEPERSKIVDNYKIIK